MDKIQEYLDTLNYGLQDGLSNPYVASLVKIFFIMYAGMLAPKLPGAVAKLFDYTVFKILILALILYINNFSPDVAILVAVAFFISLQTLSRIKLFDFAGQYAQAKKFLGLQKDQEATAAAAAIALQQKTESPIEGNDEMENYGLEVTDTQVSGLATRTNQYMGPQGLEHPMGYGGELEGADANF
jgi:hypothetical protein